MPRPQSVLTLYMFLMAMAILLTLASPTREPVHMFYLAIHNRVFADTLLLTRDACVWAFGGVAYVGLYAYAQTLGRARAGLAMRRVATGVGLLVLSAALPGILWRGVDTFVVSNTTAELVHRVVGTYLGLGLTLPAFLLIGLGVRALLADANVQMRYRTWYPSMMLSTVVGVLLTYFVAYNYILYQTELRIPVVVLLGTVLVPYIYTWLIGLASVAELRVYAQETDGIIYRKALSGVGQGLAVLVITQIGIECVEVSVANQLNLASAITTSIVLILSALQVISFLLIAFGARQLSKIEVV